MVRGEGFVRLVPTLVFLETFVDMLLWHHASLSTLYRVAQTPDLVACSSWIQYQHKWMTTQTRVLIIEKFYAVAKHIKFSKSTLGGWGGVGRGKGIHTPMNHCCPPPNRLKKVPKQCYVFKATYASPLHIWGGGGVEVHPISCRAERNINPLVEDNGVLQAVPLSN